ncbi:MAG: hypothetical protein ACYDBQ_03065 [Thermoplasmatota archaeon]
MAGRHRKRQTTPWFAASGTTMKVLPLIGMILLLVLAGCASPTPAPTTAAPAPTTTTTQPAPTTTVVSTPSPPMVGSATITAVNIVSAPERVAVGAQAAICWRVEGSGHLPHVAVHWDTTSHPNSTSFADYLGGAMYPNDGQVADPAGYDLPAVFCTHVPAQKAGIIYYRGHALNPTSLPGVLSPEHSFAVGDYSPVTFVGDVAKVAAPGTQAVVCWQVTGSTAHVPHVAVHWDIKSHPSSTNFADYQGGTAYPDNGTSAASAGYTLPGPFCTGVPIPPSGTVYFRAHVLGGPFAGLGNLSEEQSIDVATPVSIVSLPPTAAAASSVPVCWRVDAPHYHVPHTAVHFDTTSHAGSGATFADYQGGATYPNGASMAAAAGYDLSAQFCSTLTMPSGTLYLRAHVMGGPFANPGLLTPEAAVQVG